MLPMPGKLIWGEDAKQELKTALRGYGIRTESLDTPFGKLISDLLPTEKSTYWEPLYASQTTI
jgi:hypothetical protein